MQRLSLVEESEIKEQAKHLYTVNDDSTNNDICLETLEEAQRNLNTIQAYIQEFEKQLVIGLEKRITKKIVSFITALRNLHSELQRDIQKQAYKNSGSIKQGQAFKVAHKTTQLLAALEDKESSEQNKLEALNDYKKVYQPPSYCGALARAVAAVFITGICCVISGALGFTLGCVIGSVAGPVGAITVGMMAIPKSAAIGATAGTALGTALGFGPGSWMSWRLFQPKTARLMQNVADTGKKYYARKSC